MLGIVHLRVGNVDSELPALRPFVPTDPPIALIWHVYRDAACGLSTVPNTLLDTEEYCGMYVRGVQHREISGTRVILRLADLRW